MADILFVLGAVGILAIVGEVLWRRRRVPTEFTRKFVHISVACFAASWPWFLDWDQIILVSVVLLAGVVVSSYKGIFKGIHSVDRLTWGEVLFAVAIGVCAMLTTDPYIYCAAMLHLGLADGLAAVAGKRFGGRSHYEVFHNRKSVVGSLMFIAVSSAIVAWYALYAGDIAVKPALLALPPLMAGLENITVRGGDNLAVPIGVVLFLSLFG
jgi:phytol kinase